MHAPHVKTKMCILPQHIIGLAIAVSCIVCRSYRDPAHLKPVTGPHVWKAADFSPVEDHATWFTEEDLTELRAAVQQAIATGKELKVTKYRNPLGQLMAAEGALPQPPLWPPLELSHDCVCSTYPCKLSGLRTASLNTALVQLASAYWSSCAVSGPCDCIAYVPSAYPACPHPAFMPPSFLQDMTKEDFALPSLGSKLVALRDQVVHGTGFVLLRGLPVGQWSQDEIAAAYWGIGRHWGNPQSQNRLHHLLGHVKVREFPFFQMMYSYTVACVSAHALLCSYVSAVEHVLLACWPQKAYWWPAALQLNVGLLDCLLLACHT